MVAKVTEEAEGFATAEPRVHKVVLFVVLGG
jgi:hypothetical protein